MKQISLLLTIYLIFTAGTSAIAQPSQRYKMIHMAAVRMAEQISVPDSAKEAFISIFQSYKKEGGDIMKVHPQTSSDAEQSAEMKILSDFEKSEKILALRKKYYFKFREILSPTQIQKMYNVERALHRSRLEKSNAESREID